MARPRLLLLSLGLFALTAAACGAADTTSSIEDAAAPPATGACLEDAEDCHDTGGDSGGVDPEPGEATRVEPTDGLEDVHPVGWDAIEVAPDDQRQITVFWWSGVAPCNALAEVDVVHGADAVTVTVLEGNVPSDEPRACIELAQYTSTSLTLDEEIGPRSILDGAEGR